MKIFIGILVLVVLTTIGITSLFHDYVGGEEFRCPGCTNVSGRIDNYGYLGVKSFKVECHFCGLNGQYDSFISLVESWPLTEKP